MALARRAVELDPDNAKIHQLAGESLLAVRNTEEAITFLRRAVLLNPRDGLARIQLGRALPVLGNQIEALEQLQIGESLVADDEINAWALIAYGYRLLNRHESAARAFEVWEGGQSRLKSTTSCSRSSHWAYLGIRDYRKALVCINEHIQNDMYGIGGRLIKVNAFSDPALDQAELLCPAAGHIGMVAGSKAMDGLWRPLAGWLHRHASG